MHWLACLQMDLMIPLLSKSRIARRAMLTLHLAMDVFVSYCRYDLFLYDKREFSNLIRSEMMDGVISL